MRFLFGFRQIMISPHREDEEAGLDNSLRMERCYIGGGVIVASDP